MSPAFPANDSPETIAASAELGIQHPPGYPLHSLLGRVMVMAWPLGSAAWRVNCLAAALGVLAALLAGVLGRALCGPGIWAWPAAMLGAGLWRVGWEQATEAKGGIYLLNSAICLGLLILALAYQARPQARLARMFALLGGLGLANHYMSALIFLGPCALLMLRRDRSALRSAWWILPGASLYLLLPLRAAWEPFNNLGNPSSWAGFLWVLLRRGYTQGGMFSQWSIAFDQLRLWALNSLSFGAYWVAPLGIWGFVALWKRERSQAGLLGAVYALVFVSVVLINRTLPDVRWLADIFMLPASALLAALAAPGLEELGRGWGKAVIGVAIALGLALAFSHFRQLDRSGDYLAFDYGANLMSSLPKGAAYAADGDYHYMPLIYHQQILGRRRDAELLVAPLLTDSSYRGRLFRRRGLRLQGRNPGSVAQDFAGAGMPLVLSPWHPTFDEAALKPLLLTQRGLVLALSAAQAPRMDLAWAWALRSDPRREPEPLDRQLLPWYAVAMVGGGNALEGLGRHAEAARAYRYALGLPGDQPKSRILFNLGAALEREGKLGEAAQAFTRASEAEPSLEPARQKAAELEARLAPLKAELGRADALAAKGDAAQALPIYGRIVAKGYENAALWRNVGVLKYQKGDFKGADEAFQKALGMEPWDALLSKYRIMCLQHTAPPAEFKNFVEAAWRRTDDPELGALLQRLKP